MTALPRVRPPRAIVSALAGAVIAVSGVVAAEPLSVGDLARFFAASQAMQRGDGDASAYRAGRYDGYLGALADVLRAQGEVCLPACSCGLRERLDPILERQLADPALDRSQPAATWIAARLRESFPCPASN